MILSIKKGWHTENFEFDSATAAMNFAEDYVRHFVADEDDDDKPLRVNITIEENDFINKEDF